MPHIINPRLAVVVAFALLGTLLVSACSASNDPQQAANKDITQVNAAIAKHNKLFDQARGTYNKARARIKSGSDPSAQKTSIRSARTSIQKAREHLQDARNSLSKVQNLNVQSPVKRYARTLSGAMQTQIKAEGQEAEFYRLLENDPSLKNNRKQATELLKEIGSGYSEASKEYREAQNLADSNSNLLKPVSQTS